MGRLSQGLAGPCTGERPAAYVIVLGDTEICQRFDTDLGIAAQSILLGAVEAGYGGCMVASIQRDKLRAALSIPKRYCILLVIALGKPVEQVVIEPLEPNGNIQYWRDADGVHHVPKRALEDVLVDWDAGKELSD
jgi:nitroreductase